MPGFPPGQLHSSHRGSVSVLRATAITEPLGEVAEAAVAVIAQAPRQPR